MKAPPLAEPQWPKAFRIVNSSFPPIALFEDVLVDTRGNIYITDKQWGLWVLRYTGQGQPAPTAK